MKYQTIRTEATQVNPNFDLFITYVSTFRVSEAKGSLGRVPWTRIKTLHVLKQYVSTLTAKHMCHIYQATLTEAILNWRLIYLEAARSRVRIHRQCHHNDGGIVLSQGYTPDLTAIRRH